MIRKMAICAVVALIPGFALAAGGDANGAASAVNAAPTAGGHDKSNVTVKTDATAKPDVAAKKAFHHRGAHKTGNLKAGAAAGK